MSFFTRQIKYSLSGLLLVVFIWIGGFGFLSATQAPHHEHRSDCVLTLGDQVICAMDPLSYLSAWQSLFTVPLTLITTFLLLVIALGLALLYTYRKKLPFTTAKVIGLQENLRGYHQDIPDLFTQLFSQGILHTKVP